MNTIRTFILAVTLSLTLIAAGSFAKEPVAKTEKSSPQTSAKAAKDKRLPSSSPDFRCYNVNVEEVPSLEKLIVQWPRSTPERSFYIYFSALDTNGRQWANGFNCVTREKFYDCVGHDDSGQFKILKPLAPFKMKVRFISLGNPDDPGPVISDPGTEAYLDLEGSSIACPRY